MSTLPLDQRVREVERLLSRPQATPNEFSTWIIKWLQQNIDISTYQIRGLADTFFKAAPVIAAMESTASGSMVDLATVGPTLSALGNGKYLAFWGGNMSTVGGDTVGAMGISPNGAAASTVHVAKARVTNVAEYIPVIYSTTFDLQGIDQNTLQAKYRAESATPRWNNRWLVALKVEQ